MAGARFKPCVLLLGTCDTKLSELLYLRSHVIQHGVDVKLMDVGREDCTHQDIDYSHAEVLSRLSDNPKMDAMERGQVIETIFFFYDSVFTEIYSHGMIDGIICIGGSGGTSLGASVMRRALPIGLPKLIVSTVASGNVGNFVGETDITMMHSVVDIAGQNSILNPILENAAGMIAGAATAYHHRLRREKEKHLTKENHDVRCHYCGSRFGEIASREKWLRSLRLSRYWRWRTSDGEAHFTASNRWCIRSDHQ